MRRHLLFGTELYALPILRPLAAAIRARGDEARWFFSGVDPRPHLGRDDAPLVATVAAVRAFAPDTVFAAANWVPPFFPGTKVQVFHGFNVEKRDAARGHFRIRGLFDLYCTQGPATTAPFAALADASRRFRVVETGWPKLDPLFAPDDADARALRAPAGQRPVIAFGSTFTERLAAAPVLHDEIARLVARGDRYWLLTLHPKSPRALVDRYRTLAGPHARFVETDAVIPMLRAADVLVADTSSIVSEFVVQRRPVVTFRNRAPKPHMLDIAEPSQLDEAIARALAPDAAWRDAIAAYADAIHPSRDGRASDRVLDAAAAFDRTGLAPLPWNPWRTLQMRWRLRRAWR